MSEEKEATEFRVVDKRRFSQDGESRADTSNDTQVNHTLEQSSNVIVDSGAKEKSQLNEQGPINFSSFVLGIYTHTLIFLGDIPHPETNEISVNMEAAKQNIDILSILEEKTKGNLTDEEAHLMKEVLDMLRLQFISKK